MSAASESKRSNRKAKKKRSAQQTKESQASKVNASNGVRGFSSKLLLHFASTCTILPKAEVLVLLNSRRNIDLLLGFLSYIFSLWWLFLTSFFNPTHFLNKGTANCNSYLCTNIKEYIFACLFMRMSTCHLIQVFVLNFKQLIKKLSRDLLYGYMFRNVHCEIFSLIRIT